VTPLFRFAFGEAYISREDAKAQRKQVVISHFWQALLGIMIQKLPFTFISLFAP